MAFIKEQYFWTTYYFEKRPRKVEVWKVKFAGSEHFSWENNKKPWREDIIFPETDKWDYINKS